MQVECPSCSASHEFAQPYPYHAGFGDSVFLYNRTGNRTLVWGTYDPVYTSLLGAKENAWNPSAAVCAYLEAQLPPSPAGDPWGFAYPARCQQCGAVLRAAMADGEIYYLEYPGSVILGRAGLPSTLSEYLTSRLSNRVDE